MDAVHFYLQQLSNRFVSDCEARAARFRQLRTMREVKHGSDAVMRSELRGEPQARMAMTRMIDAATRRMNELLEQQMQELARCATLDAFQEARGRLMAGHWPFLRGEFGALYVQATRRAEMLHAALARRPPPPDPATPAADQPATSASGETPPAPRGPRRAG